LNGKPRKKEIAFGTVKNYYKVVKSFFEMNSINLNWSPIIDGLGRGQDLVYRQYCDRLLEPEREWNDNDDDEFVPDQ
jgi:hypothetical protein